MQTTLRIIIMAVISMVIGLAVNAISSKPLPLIGNESQFEVAVPEGQKADHSEIQTLFESGEAFFVDARSVEAFVEGHIPGSFSIPYTEFEGGTVPEKVELLPRDMTLVIYCDGADCHASKEVADHLLEIGFLPEFVRVFHGGWKEWQENGGEVETGEPL